MFIVCDSLFVFMEVSEFSKSYSVFWGRLSLIVYFFLIDSDMQGKLLVKETILQLLLVLKFFSFPIFRMELSSDSKNN